MSTQPLIDSHCHLGHIDRPTDEVLGDASAAGVELVIDIGMGLGGSAEAARRAGTYPQVRAAVGVHPNDVAEFVSDPESTMSTLRRLLSEPGVVAVGETGIDLYRDRSDPSHQREAFRAHIDLAKGTDRTLVIHCRDAQEEVLAVLDETGAPPRVVMHCFSGDVAHARACDERGFYCSFAGNLTYKRNDDLRAAARAVSVERLLVETDAPYLAPMPHRGKPNEPAFVALTARALAEARGMSDVEMLQVLNVNTRRAFAL